MKQNTKTRIVLSEIEGGTEQQLKFLALLNLGIVQSLASGALGVNEAVALFYHAENCLYVQKRFRNKHANAIMSHGVQLPDLFEALSAAEASREFFRELEAIRSRCMKLLAVRKTSGTLRRMAVRGA